MTSLYQTLLDGALRHLARRAYTTQQIRKKLGEQVVRMQRRHKMPAGEDDASIETAINAVMGRLNELKVVDDLDYCSRFVAERNRLKPRGKYALDQELRQKGITKETLEAFWASPEGEAFAEIPLAQRLVEKRAAIIQRRYPDASSYDRKQKLYAFLARKGFKPKTIHAVLDKAQNSY